jgi:hypothetical protein
MNTTNQGKLAHIATDDGALQRRGGSAALDPPYCPRCTQTPLNQPQKGDVAIARGFNPGVTPAPALRPEGARW